MEPADGTPIIIRDITIIRTALLTRTSYPAPLAGPRSALERAVARVLQSESDRLLTAALLGIPAPALRQHRLTVAEALADEQRQQRTVPVAPGVELLMEEDRDNHK